MKEFKISTRIFMFGIYLLGAIFLTRNLFDFQVNEPIMLLVLCILASLALIIKVTGATNRSHYSFSFIVYGFAFAYLGVPQTVIVILVSNLVEYLVHRPAWFGPVFNTACYIIVINIAGLVFNIVDPNSSLVTVYFILAVTASMTVFTVINHLLVGIIVWLANGENFQKSGIFDLLPLIIDLTLLSLGAMLVLVWEFNPYALLLFAFPIYLIYGTMRVPELERQTEIDQKTGLFNHTYFMQHLTNEINRANRFDRPLTIIMADLDLLRNINNTYGHLAGDEVLIKIADILKNSVRDYDVVARFGGEEFSILMPETHLAQGHERAEAIRREIERTDFIIPTSVTPIKVTISLGIASREDFDQVSKDIIHNADTALYHAKLKGRNRVYVYSKEAYRDFFGPEGEKLDPEEVPDESPKALDDKPLDETRDYPAATAKLNPSLTSTPTAQPEETQVIIPPKAAKTDLPVYIYIGILFCCAVLGFLGIYRFVPSLFSNFSISSWLGLGACAVLVIITEWFSIDLYARGTSLSTSAVPILAGTLLFGPIGSLVLSLVYVITTGIAHRSPFNRYVFNFSNQLIVGLLYTWLISFTGQPFIALPTAIQLGLAVLSAIIVYLVNTILISIGVHIDSKEPVLSFWKEHYSWLLPIYIGMGVVAASFVFGYKHDPIVGSLLVIVPLILLRTSQVQFVERTRTMVTELREKNSILERISDEITNLNEGLLETLAETIDLRDPYVLGHSRRVTEFATEIAKRLGLHEKQVELIRKGSLLHDIGKLGITEDILSKPARLTVKEYAIIQKHPSLGASLLEKSLYLRPLIPIVRQHHEHFDGKGYPDKLSGSQISIEARIVSVADAIEAMSSDRPYRKALSQDTIIEELTRCSGTQFDPRIVEKAIRIMREMEIGQAPERANERVNPKYQRSLSEA